MIKSHRSRIKSFDFWDTLVIRKSSGETIRLGVCQEAVSKFEFNFPAIELLVMFQMMSDGLKCLASSLDLDSEYRLKVAWYYVGINLFPNSQKANEFSEFMISREITNAIKHSRPRRRLVKILESTPYYIISDFEGDGEYLRSIIHKFGMKGPEGIWVSSEEFANKASGNLYRKVLSDLSKIDGQEFRIFHTGDNRKSDGEIPRKMGLNAKILRVPPRRVKLNFKRILQKVLSETPFISSFKRDVLTLSGILNSSVSEIRKKSERANMVFFLGSEGAFISQTLDDVFGACLNFGRLHILKAAVSTDMDFVISRLILEKWGVKRFLQFFQLEDSDAYRQFVRRSILHRDASDIAELRKISSNLYYCERADIEKYLQLKDCLLIDVGYKGTSAVTLSRMSGNKLDYFQMFGDYALCTPFPREWQTLYKSNESSIFGLFRINKVMIEKILSIGPRAPKSTQNLAKMRQMIQARKTAKPPSKLRIQLLFLHPSRKTKRIIEEIQLFDDVGTLN